MTLATGGRIIVAASDPGIWPDVATVPASAGRARIAQALFSRMAARLPLRVTCAPGPAFGAGGPGSPVMVLHRPADFYRRIGAAGLIGFGESFMAGDWDCDDLSALLTIFARQADSLVPRPLQALRRFYVRRRPAADDGSERNARHNARRHYDLSNDLFALFLDSAVTRSTLTPGASSISYLVTVGPRLNPVTWASTWNCSSTSDSASTTMSLVRVRALGAVPGRSRAIGGKV